MFFECCYVLVKAEQAFNKDLYLGPAEQNMQTKLSNYLTVIKVVKILIL